MFSIVAFDYGYVITFLNNVCDAFPYLASLVPKRFKSIRYIARVRVNKICVLKG